MSKTHGQTISVAAAGNLSRTGYTFIGWSESATATTTASFSPGQSISNIDRDYSLYAVWRENAQPPATTYSVTYDANGATSGNVPVDGTEYESGNSANILGNSGALERTDYKLLGWALSSDATAATYTGGENMIINGDVTLYAVWEKVTGTEVVPEPKEPEAPNPTPSTPSTPKEKLVSAAKDEGIPVLPGGVPLVAPNGILSWALLNLIIAVAGIIFAILMFAGMYRRYKEYNDGELGRYENEFSEKKKTSRKLWAVLSVLLTIISIVFFFLTEDMSLPMVLVDKWTIVNALIFAAEIVGIMLTSKKIDDEEEATAIA